MQRSECATKLYHVLVPVLLSSEVLADISGVIINDESTSDIELERCTVTVKLVVRRNRCESTKC